MQPNQNPYDFITNSPHGPTAGQRLSQRQRLIRVAIFGTLLLVVAIVVLTVISSFGGGPKNQLLEVGAAQADLIALTKTAAQSSSSPTLKTDAQMLLLTITTQNQETVALMSKYGLPKDPSKQFAQYQDGTFEKKLESAKADNTFDDTYRTILADKLGLYRAKLQNLYAKVSPNAQKQQLSAYYLQLETLMPTTKQ